VVHEQDSLLQSSYAAHLGLEPPPLPSLGYAQVIEVQGFHLMAMPTRHWGEQLTGLGASGVNVIVALVNHQPLPGHPMIPVLQLSEHPHGQTDLLLTGEPYADSDRLLNMLIARLLNMLIATFTGDYLPNVLQSGNVNFQVTRGLLGVSL